MGTLTRGVYVVGPRGDAVPNWFPPGFDTAAPFDGIWTNPFLTATPQVIGVFDTRPAEKPEQPETHKEIAWSAAEGGVTLRINAPFSTRLFTAEGGLVSTGETFSAGWPGGSTLRLWVGGVDYFHASDNAQQYGNGGPVNNFATQIRPAIAGAVPQADGIDNELLRYVQSGNPSFLPYATNANPRQRRIFEALLNSSNTYDLSGLLGGATGAPIELDIASLAGGARYVWIGLDFLALPAPELTNAASPNGFIRPRFLWGDGFAPNNVVPRYDVPWTTRPGRCDMDIDPPEVRICIPAETDGANNMSVADLQWWGNPTENGIRFTARGCRGRKRFHVWANCFYNRQQTEAFSSLFARVTTGGGGSFVQDLQHPATYAPINTAVVRDANAQPTVPIWGYLHDTAAGDAITAGHTGQVSGVTVELVGIRPSVDVPFAPFPYGTAPGCIVTLGD
jgi:hypothetical protein